MATLKEILADTENYANDLEVSVKGVPVKLGDLRQFVTQEHAARASELEQRAASLNAMESQLTQQAESVAAYQAELEQLRGQQNGQKSLLDQLNDLTRQNKKTVLDEPGEYFSPLVDSIKELRAQRETLAKELKEFRDQSNAVVKWAVGRQARQEFEALPNKPKELTIKQLIDHALKQRYTDELGYPDLGRAYQDVTAPTRAAEHEKAIRQDERKKALDEARAAAASQIPNSANEGVFVPMPGNRGTALPKTSKHGGIERIPTETVLNDPDIMRHFVQ